MNEQERQDLQDILEALRLMQQTADVIADMNATTEKLNAQNQSAVAPEPGPDIREAEIDVEAIAFDIASGAFDAGESDLDPVKELHLSELFDGDLRKATGYVVGATTEGNGVAWTMKGSVMDTCRSYAYLGASMIESIAEQNGLPLDDVREMFINSVDFVLGERGHD